MPVAARVIANPFEYVPHKSYTAGKPTPIVLQSVNVASMVGSIHQIALLADYATEIFDNLQKTTLSIHDRICDITNRTSILNNQIPEINRAVLERNVSTLVSGSKKSEASPETQMLTPITRPRQISLRYEVLNKIPKVDQMDQYLTAEELSTKGKCSDLYSNPLFFFNEWVRVENARQQVIQEEREKKKREKQERKALLKKEKEKRRATLKPEKKKELNWRERLLKANPNLSIGTGSGTEAKKSTVIIHMEPEEVIPPSRRSMLTDIWEKTGDGGEGDNDEDDKPEEQDDPSSKQSGPAFAPPPPPPSFAPSLPPSMPPSLPPSMPPSMPPPLPSGLPPPPPVPPSAPPQMPSYPPPPNQIPSAPNSPPPPLPPVPPPPPSARSPNSFESPPPTPSSEAYLSSTTSSVELELPPPPPRRPNPFGASDLMTSITQGKKLRSVAEGTVPEKSTPKKPSLLDEISKGKNLKKVNHEEAALKKQESKAVEKGILASTGDAVASILARRKYIEESESESDDSDEGEWS